MQSNPQGKKMFRWLSGDPAVGWCRKEGLQKDVTLTVLDMGVYTFKIDQALNFKHVQFIRCQLRLNKATKY